MTKELLDIFYDQYIAARRLIMQHDNAFYGPMRGASCGCDFCQWPRQFVLFYRAIEEKVLSERS